MIFTKIAEEDHDAHESLLLTIGFSGRSDATDWTITPLTPSHGLAPTTKTIYWKDSQKFMERIQNIGDLPAIFKLRDFYADWESSFFHGRAKIINVTSAAGTSGQGSSIVEVDIVGEQFGEIGETDALALSFLPEIHQLNTQPIVLTPIHYQIPGNLLTLDWRKLTEQLEREKFIQALLKHIDLGLKIRKKTENTLTKSVSARPPAS